MPQEYERATDVEAVARDLINDSHPHLGPVRIEFVFITEAPTVNGKVVWGRAKKISGLNAWLASDTQEVVTPEEFFVIEIVKPIWQQLDEKSRKALTEHELMHCDVDLETGRLSIRPHDLEEFNAIVRKYGLWRDDVEIFYQVAKEQQEKQQERLPGFTSITLSAGDKEVTMSAEKWDKAVDRLKKRLAPDGSAQIE